jgi:hypothetical protein
MYTVRSIAQFYRLYIPQCTYPPPLSMYVICISLETAACLLERAIRIEKEDYQPLVDSIYLVEVSNMFEHPTVPTHMLKNAGLAHLHYAQHKAEALSANAVPPPKKDLFGALERLQWPSASTG